MITRFTTFSLFLSLAAFASENTVRETAVYQTPNGSQIATLKAGTGTEASGPRPDGFSKVVLRGKSPDPTFGYIKTSDLNPASIPERALEKTWAGLKIPTRRTLEPYLRHFHFQELKTLGEKYETLSIDTNLGDGPTPQGRLYLIFQKDLVVGIIHLYDLKLAKAPADQKLKRDYQLIWLLPNTQERKRFITTFDGVNG